MKNKLFLSIIICISLIFSNMISTFAQTTEEVKSLSVSTESVVIKANGYSAYVDVNAILKDGSSIKVNTDAYWTTSNQNVAFAWNGRILAQSKGTATITVTYKGLSKKISVKVLNTINLKSMLNNSVSSTKGVSALSLSDSQRDGIISKASAMLTVAWRPTQDLVGWRGGYTFQAGTGYNGIPYTQWVQVDENGFTNALNNSDFYSTVNNDGTLMPTYGNDCSGYVSFAWGISRKNTWQLEDGITNEVYSKVGSYSNSPTYSELYSSYSSLQRGDAVVQNKDPHTFIIGANYGSYVVCYEQTPYFVQVTIHDYTELANAGYKPFSLK